ncbi:MAG: cytochrome b N-terminal domain-containing protein [Acidimicrobiales bacterium]
MVNSSLLASVVDLNGPDRYLHWSIFTVSEANLVLIVVMVAIFGAALLIRFPDHGSAPPPQVSEDSPTEPGSVADRETVPVTAVRADLGEDADAAMWSSRLRRQALRLLPPGKLLPDRQPAYVASWIYVFGVAWMAAWRGRRALTWVTGVVAFMMSIVECFTGYVSQQNFDSQWISTSGKDAFDAVGVGAFFNVMNFGQMLMWHIVLLPLVLVAIVGAHVLAVRVRGVVHPLPARRDRGRAALRAAAAADRADWQGPTRRYDIIKEASAASLVAVVLVVALAALLSSPDVPPLSIATWANVAPADFVGTAASELAGTSETATYGPPYNSGSGSTQRILFSPETIVGVRQHIVAAQTFVLSPLEKAAPSNPALAAALRRYNAASPARQGSWANAYAQAITKLVFHGSTLVVPPAADGPVPVLISTELTLARSGALDADLISNQSFYGTDFTKPLLFLEDGQYFSNVATADHLSGAQWGVMNETGSYPGQPWLWLYTLWYQVPGFDNSGNVDLIAVYLTGAATILLLAVPFIPGLRDIPRLVPVHRLIWRQWHDKDKP